MRESRWFFQVCLVIGQYDMLQTVADGRTKVRVFTPWGQREQGRFALEVSSATFKLWDFFSASLNHHFLPLKKRDAAFDYIK